MRAFATLLVMSCYGILSANAMLITPRHSTLEALISGEVIPDVIPESLNFRPTTFPAATFHNDTCVAVKLGNFIPKPKTQSQPTVQFYPDSSSSSPSYSTKSSPTQKYTLCMTDPDAKSRETHENAEFLHWLITDLTLPSKHDEDVDLSKGKVLVSYLGPGPPKGTGKHRYVLLLFKNEEGKELKVPGDRSHWGYEVEGTERVGAMRYAGENGLTLVGANFFQTEF